MLPCYPSSNLAAKLLIYYDVKLLFTSRDKIICSTCLAWNGFKIRSFIISWLLTKKQKLQGGMKKVNTHFHTTSWLKNVKDSCLELIKMFGEKLNAIFIIAFCDDSLWDGGCLISLSQSGISLMGLRFSVVLLADCHYLRFTLSDSIKESLSFIWISSIFYSQQNAPWLLLRAAKQARKR